MGQSIYHRYAAGSAAVAEAWTPGRTIAIREIRFHASTAFGAGDTIKVSVDSAINSKYDFVILTKSMNGQTQALFQPDAPVYVESGEVIDATLTNLGGDAWSLDIIWSPV